MCLGSRSKLWRMRVWGHFGAHHRPYPPIVVFTWPIKWFCIVFGCGTRPCHPKLAYATTAVKLMWLPGTLNLKLHSTISNIDARKKLDIIMGVRRIPRRFGMLASDFTQCQYLTTENSIRCHLSSFSCDPSSRQICAFDSSARDRIRRFL